MVIVLPTAALCAGLRPGPAVVAIARQRQADHHDQAGVGVDDYLVVGGVAVVLRLLGDLVVPGGHQGAVHDQHRVLGEPLAGMQREPRADVADHSVCGRLRHPEQRGQLPHRQVRSPVRGDQQHPVLQRQLPRPAPARGVGTSRRSAVTNLLKTVGRSPVNGAIQDGSEAVITPDTVKIIAEQDHLRDGP
jgi:hypothetical protein